LDPNFSGVWVIVPQYGLILPQILFATNYIRKDQKVEMSKLPPFPLFTNLLVPF
jgi:hypothetical protein